MKLEEEQARTVIRPEEFSALIEIYKMALAEPWFSRNEDDRKQFSPDIIMTFRGRLPNRHELRAHCLEMAKERYSLQSRN